jgi:hypothetical protein
MASDKYLKNGGRRRVDQKMTSDKYLKYEGRGRVVLRGSFGWHLVEST